jgi:hypothetical protein
MRLLASLTGWSKAAVLALDVGPDNRLYLMVDSGLGSQPAAKLLVSDGDGHLSVYRVLDASLG